MEVSEPPDLGRQRDQAHRGAAAIAVEKERLEADELPDLGGQHHQLRAPAKHQRLEGRESPDLGRQRPQLAAVTETQRPRCSVRRPASSQSGDPGAISRGEQRPVQGLEVGQLPDHSRQLLAAGSIHVIILGASRFPLYCR